MHFQPRRVFSSTRSRFQKTKSKAFSFPVFFSPKSGVFEARTRFHWFKLNKLKNQQRPYPATLFFICNDQWFIDRFIKYISPNKFVRQSIKQSCRTLRYASPNLVTQSHDKAIRIQPTWLDCAPTRALCTSCFLYYFKALR